MFVIGPDKKVKLTLTYPAAIGRNVDEIVRVLDALQLSAEYAVSTPVNWNDGDDVIISPAVSDDDAASSVPQGLHDPQAVPAPDAATEPLNQPTPRSLTTAEGILGDETAGTDDDHHAPGTGTGARRPDAPRDLPPHRPSRRPVGIAELNEQFPFNHNAIRQHLAKLVAAGLVIESEGPDRRARPAPPGLRDQPGRRGAMGHHRPLRTAQPPARRDHPHRARPRRGRPPGRRPASGSPSPSGDVVADITAAMARQGFEPEVRPVRGGAEIVLHNCPFATAALADRDTICALHLGIAEGLTDASAAAVTELVAYDPRKAGCRLRIRLVADDDEADDAGTLTLRGKAGAR